MHLKYEKHWPLCSVQIGNMNLTDISSYSFTHPLLIQFLAPSCSKTERSKALTPSARIPQGSGNFMLRAAFTVGAVGNSPHS